MALNLTKLVGNLVEFHKKYQDIAHEEVLDAVDTIINFIDENSDLDDEPALADIIDERYEENEDDLLD